jgi:nitrate reductase delta subunit
MAWRDRPPYKLLSLLLQYPDERMLCAREAIEEAVDALPASFERDRIRSFLEFWSKTPPTQLRQEYVETFDLARKSALYLSYYVHGDTRKRGVSLLRLKKIYAVAGLIKEEGELPDYLPVMLEFAELAPAGYGERVLGEYRISLELLRRALAERRSPYALLVEAVCHRLPGLNPLQRSDLARIVSDGPPAEQVGLEPFAPPEVMPSMRVRP